MTDGVTIAGALLVLAALGGVPVAYPPFLTIWSASREDHVRVVAAHRRAWALLNAGFFFATVITSAGLAVLAATLGGDAVRTALLVAIGAVYAIAGAMWCAVVAIRTQATPLLLDLGAIDAPPGPAEHMLQAASGGLFAAFVLATGTALVALGVVLALAGGVAAPVAWLAALIAAVVIAAQLATGDAIPAVLYFPTILIGLALLAGWS